MNLEESKRREIEELFELTPQSQVENVPQWERDLYKELKAQEGMLETTTVPTRGDVPTIGHGHTGDRAIPGAKITEDEASQLLKQDIYDRRPEIHRLMPEFEVYPPELQVPLASSHFRGSLGGSPKTLEHINNGEFIQAADEFLDNDEYRDAESRGRAGIRPRMEKTSNALRKFGTGQHPSNNLISGTR